MQPHETVADIGEDALIHRITQGFNLPADAAAMADVVVGIGDDCAVVKPPGRGWHELLKTDCIVQDIHFLPDTAADQVGWKAMARVVSDMAAMGGLPRHALVTIMLPKTCAVSYVERLYAGMQKCAQQFGILLVGGETTSGPRVMISIAMTGRVESKRVLHRSGAKPGDAIYITGRLGGSLRGHHLNFVPRLHEARWLAANFRIHAMMDLSDGLAKDLPRMARLAGLEHAIFIDETRLPLNEGCTAQQALSDGEDYELLFTVSARSAKKLEAKWAAQFPKVPLTRIGRFLPAGDGNAAGKKAKKPLEKWRGGWDHFSA